MDRLYYEIKIIDILDEAWSDLNSEELESLLIRIEEVVNYYIQNMR